MKKKVLFLDMDEVLAKTIKKVLELYNNEYGLNVKYEDITDWNLTKFQKENTDIIKYFHQDNFFYDLEPYEDTLTYVPKLYEKFDLYVATTPSNQKSIIDKIRWLEKYFPFIKKERQIYIHNKSLLIGDVIVDDAPYNVLNAKVKLPILMKRPWNEKITNNKIIKLNNLEEVYRYFVE